MPLTDLIHLAGTTLEHIALAVVFALALATIWLSPASTSVDALYRSQVLCTLIFLLALTASIDLLIRTAAMADVSLNQAWSFIAKVLKQSEYGLYWQWRAGIWILMCAIGLGILSKGWSIPVAWLLLLSAAATVLLVSVTTHAGEDGLWSSANLINSLHVIGTSLWGGAVIVYALFVLPAQRQGGHSGDISNAALRLSTMAGAALAVVLLSGVYNSWRQLKSISDLWTTDYGEVLVIKLLFVGTMMTIGALNRFYWVPGFAAWHRKDGNRWGPVSNRLLWVLRIDSVIYIAVTTAAVVLAMQSPPAHA